MKHIKRDFGLKASVHPLGGLREWGQKNMVMLHIKLKGIANAAAW